MYRSSNTPSGRFRELGTLHIHVDGSKENDTTLSLVREFEATGRAAKLTSISRSAAGRQCLELTSTYASHNPAAEEAASRQFFSTAVLRDRMDAIEATKLAMCRLDQKKGMVIEVERVVATMDIAGHWSSIPFEEISPIGSSEIGFENSPTLPFEIHHAFDVASHRALRVTPETLVEDSDHMGIPVGGWFQFVKDDWRSYRSNAFAEADALQEKVMREWTLLDEYLRAIGPYKLWTIVEKILGVWRTPPVPLRESKAAGDLLDAVPGAGAYKGL